MSNAQSLEGTAPADPVKGALVGQAVDQFRILRLLGRGGMGEVYLARDTHLGRKVALKFMRDVRHTPQFVKEARATAQFNHPNVVTLYSVGTYREAPYVALEYLPGQTLRHRIKTDLPSYGEALELALALASALTEAHARHIVHRDLKPANIVIPSDGRLRVLDFGLAQSTRTKSAFGGAGTPAYMSAEQWEAGPVGTAADVWALGVMLYEMLDGKRPFRRYEADASTLKEAVCKGAPVPALSAPSEAVSFVTRCLARRASNRPTAREAEAQLRSLIERHQHRVAPRDARQTSKAPFRGLLPFGTMQMHLFFGRDAEIAALRERVRQDAIVAVVGPSGVGKSSLVRAGLLPRMTGFGEWWGLEMHPGSRPFQSLKACVDRGLSASLGKVSIDWQRVRHHPEQFGLELLPYAKALPSRLVLFIDQMEEVFTLPDDPDVAHSFLRALKSAAEDLRDHIRIVFTLRDDYLPRAVASHPDASAGFRQPFFVHVPGRDALVETLVGPVQTTGHRFEAGLVDRMVDAVVEDRAGLSSLQFAAFKLWEARDVERLRLTRAAYDAMGGVAGVLVQHGDRVLDGLDLQDVPIARDLLLRLVTSERTRRVVSSVEVLKDLDPRAQRVLDRLISSRLISTTEQEGVAAVELAHESLIRDWGRLREWVDEQKDDLRFLAEARKVAEVWQRRGRRSEEVWTRRSLMEAEAMLDGCAAPVPPLVTEFIAASRQAEQRRARRWRGAGLTVVSFWAIVVSVFLLQRQDALNAARQAEDNRRLAEAAQAVAELEADRSQRSAVGARNAIRLVAATRHRLSDPTLSVAWLREMEPDGPQPSGSAALVQDTLERGLTKVVFPHEDYVMSASFSSDGTRVVTASWDNTARIWQADGTETPIVLRGHEDGVNSAVFSPDGRFIATASQDKTVRVWRADGSGGPQIFRGHEGPVNSVSFSSDGEQLGTGSDDGTVRVWRIDESEAPVILRGHETPVIAVSFSPDGRRIVSGSHDTTVRVWSIESARAPIVLRGHEGRVSDVSFSPDGQHILTTSRDGTARLWRGDGSRVQKALRFGGALPLAVSFSPDGSRIAVGLGNNSIEIHRADGSGRVFVLRGHNRSIRRVSFHPDGQRIVTASWDGTARLWHLPGQDARLERSTERLWAATCYCPSIEARVEFLQVSLNEARRQHARCQARVHSSLGCEFAIQSTSEPEPKGPAGDQTSRQRAPMALETVAATRYRPELIRIPAGSFWMGSFEEEPERSPNEHRHQVTLTRSYWLAESEVTQGQWTALMGSAPSRLNRESGGGVDHPVERVSWYDAIAYCNQLSVREGRSSCYRVEGGLVDVGTGCGDGQRRCFPIQGGRQVHRIPDCTGYRLPTEAEWEHAARAGTDSAVYSGPMKIPGTRNAPAVGRIGWYGGNSGVRWGGWNCSDWESRAQFASRCGPHLVKIKTPNVFGLHDMIGNVWEWVEDEYEADLSKYVRDPVFSKAISHHVVFRGCGWSNHARLCRVAFRGNGPPAYRASNLGFRPVRSTLNPEP